MRYEVIKLRTGSLQDSNGWYLAVLSHYEAVINVIGSVEDIDITGQYCVKLLSEISPWSYHVLKLYLVFKT